MKAIRTKYHGPTNTRGSRITATDEDGNRVSISYPYELSGEAVHRKAARALCDQMGWGSNLAGGGFKDGYVFVFIDAWADALRHMLDLAERHGIDGEYVKEARELVTRT